MVPCIGIACISGKIGTSYGVQVQCPFSRVISDVVEASSEPNGNGGHWAERKSVACCTTSKRPSKNPEGVSAYARNSALLGFLVFQLKSERGNCSIGGPGNAYNPTEKVCGSGSPILPENLYGKEREDCTFSGIHGTPALIGMRGVKELSFSFQRGNSSRIVIHNALQND